MRTVLIRCSSTSIQAWEPCRVMIAGIAIVLQMSRKLALWSLREFWFTNSLNSSDPGQHRVWDLIWPFHNT